MIRCSQMAYMLKTNPLSKREKLYFSDLRNQNSISLSPSKSPNYMKNAITRYSAEAGFIPKIAYFVQSSESISENEFGEHDIFIADRYFNVLDTEQFTAKRLKTQKAEFPLCAGEPEAVISRNLSGKRQLTKGAIQIVSSNSMSIWI